MPRCLRRPAPLVPPGPAASWPREAAPTGPAIRPPQARGLPGPPSRAAAAILSSLLLSLPPLPPPRAHAHTAQARPRTPPRAVLRLSLPSRRRLLPPREGEGAERGGDAAATGYEGSKREEGERGRPRHPHPRGSAGGRRCDGRSEGRKIVLRLRPLPRGGGIPAAGLRLRRWVSGGAGASCARLKGRSAHALPARPRGGRAERGAGAIAVPRGGAKGSSAPAPAPRPGAPSQPLLPHPAAPIAPMAIGALL